MTLTVEPSDLASYLGQDVDETRASFLIGLATALCQSILSPLPDEAKPVVVVVASRAYTNPTQAQQQGAGPQTVGWPSPAGGLYLSRSDKATLRRLAGGGGAFTIDMLPPDAAKHLPPWDRNPAFSVDDCDSGEDSSSS